MARGTRADLAAWGTLFIAFSPVVADLLRGLASRPPDRSTLVAALLLCWALWLRKGDRRLPPRRDGAALLVAGALLELIGIAGGTWSLARFGLPVGALGLARLRGAPPLAVLVLGFFAIPLPSTISSLASPALETALAEAAVAPLAAAGFGVDVVGPTILGPAGRINLDARDGGLPLAGLLAGCGWFEAIRGRSPLPSILLRSFCWLLLGLPAQLLGFVVAGTLLGLGHADAGRIWLTTGTWFTAALLSLAWLWRQPSRARAG